MVKFMFMKKKWLNGILLSSLFFLSFYGLSEGAVKKAVLKEIRYFNYSNYTRVVIELTKPVKYSSGKIIEKERVRIFYDFKDTIVSKSILSKKIFTVKNGYIKGIRVGQYRKNIARVVLDFNEVKKYKEFPLTNPFRVVIDIYGEQKTSSIKMKEDRKVKSEKEVRIKPPDISGEKKQSLARQLGLGVKTIVIDPGHGGKDPGAIGRYYKTKEKTVVFDVAKKVAYYFKKYTSLDVYLTRYSDRYLSLMERTAFANSKRADLFISIHANYARNRKAFGLETFWLNFTTDPRSLEVAARENASSQKSISELTAILKKIFLNTKLIESKIFATKVHKTTLFYIKKRYYYKDMKIRKAPFYVLIGANMPSILIETGFLSNRANEKLLRSKSFKDWMAYGIYRGIMNYIYSLKRK